MANSGLTNDAFYKELQDKFPDKISNKEEQFGLLTADVDSKSLLPIIKWMKESTSISLQY